jgi:dihydroorotate dehydrogenase electron transfer subunit
VLSFLIKIYGEGSKYLAHRKAEDTLRVTGPLGRGFVLDRPVRRIVLVAGGIGIAPFPATIDALVESGRSGDDILLLLGGRTKVDLAVAEHAPFDRVAVRLATEDGSAGRRGFVTQLVASMIERGELGPEDLVLGCGPHPMLAALSALTIAAGVETQLAMEESMACGFGVCNGCAVPVLDSPGEFGIYERVCVEGPVFDARRIDWASMH